MSAPAPTRSALPLTGKHAALIAAVAARLATCSAPDCDKLADTRVSPFCFQHLSCACVRTRARVDAHAEERDTPGDAAYLHAVEAGQRFMHNNIMTRRAAGSGT